MLRTFVAFLCMCCVAPVHAKLGETVPEQSSDHEYIALLRYTGPQPEDSVWTMTVGLANVVGSVSTARPPSPVTIPLAKQTPTPPASASAVVVASATPAPHINFSPEQSTPSPRRLEPLTPAEIARRAFPSVVLLSMQDARGQPISLGSGFFVGNDVVVTNFHVIDQASAGYAKIIGQSTKLDIKGIVGLDALHDLALLQLDSSSAPPLPVAPRLSVNVGDAVYAIGNPRGLEGTFSQGIVSSVREFGADRVLQITAPISPGSSGGPVLDQTGTVVGVSVASLTNGQNLNFAIPADYVTTLQKKQTELRPFKGVPRAKPQRTLLDHLGGQQPRVGVTGEMLTYDDLLQTGVFSFSLRNELRENVANIYGILIFYDPRGEPIDIYRINYQGLVPPGMAKRLKGQVDESVERLNCPKAAGYPELPPRSPEGKAEFRILDFSVTRE